jgi:hypothetical protein
MYVQCADTMLFLQWYTAVAVVPILLHTYTTKSEEYNAVQSAVSEAV